MPDNFTPEKPEVTQTLNRAAGSGRKLILKRLLITALLLVITLAAFFLWHRETPATAPRYKTEPVRRGDLQVIITATGNLAPVNQVQVGSELSGIVKSVEVDFNDQVQVGQVLATLDTSKLEAQVLQSRASLEAARAKVLQAKATVKETTSQLKRLQTARKMSLGKAVSDQDLEAAEATLDRANADLASANATVSQNEAILKAIETDLAKTKIYSPINGVVLSRSVDPGQTVAASLQAPVLFSLAEDLTKMELQVDVDEADVGQVHEGQSATFTVDAFPERVFHARIFQVRYGSNTVDGVVTYKTLLDVDNSDLSLRPGMTATADIIVKEMSDALLVPNAALRFVPRMKDNDGPDDSPKGASVLSRLFPRPRRGGQRKEVEIKGGKKEQKVWMKQAGGLVSIPVKTGATNGVLTEITNGELQPGQELVVDSIESRP